MSLTSYRAAPPRGCFGWLDEEARFCWSLTGGPGDDLLSHRWACSTMGAQGFHGRVRNGVGWVTLAVITRPSGQGLTGRHGLSWILGHPVRGARVERPARTVVRLVVLVLAGFVWSSLCSSMVLARSWRGASSVERLGSVSSTPCGASTADLSTWWSSTALIARPGFEGGFPLRCFQRLSCPDLATQLCRWHDNWSTRDPSTPVLSY
jgi:hypothetical protein